ncbi:MAG: FMN-binding protein [Clostridiales bacterium]|nr:FMN-binding protein [Clostridiales bacterium]
MKKLIVIALAVVMALSLVLVLAACGGEQELEGSCNYANKYDATKPDYGVKVKVTVKGDTIMKVELVDYAEWTRTTSTWTESTDKKAGDEGYQLGYTKTEAAYAQWLEDTFVGQKVDTVKGWTATATVDGQSVGEGVPCITGATQSSARIIVAVQNALSKLA